MVKHYGQWNLQKEGFIWVYGSKGIRVYDGGAAGMKVRIASWAHTLNAKQEAERANRNLHTLKAHLLGDIIPPRPSKQTSE